MSKLADFFSWLTGNLRAALTRSTGPRQLGKVIEGNVQEVMIKLESALNFRDIGGGVWSPSNGTLRRGKSGTIGFKFRPHSLSGPTEVTDKLPLSLLFTIEQNDAVSHLSWTYSVDNASFQNTREVIETTEQIIKSLLEQD